LASTIHTSSREAHRSGLSRPTEVSGLSLLGPTGTFEHPRLERLGMGHRGKTTFREELAIFTNIVILAITRVRSFWCRVGSRANAAAREPSFFVLTVVSVAAG